MKLTLGNQEIEITEDQRKKIAEALNLKTPDDVDKWPKNGNAYWYLDATGDIMMDNWADHHFDMSKYEIGNVFRTKDEARAHLSYLKALTRVKGSSSFNPNWEDTIVRKYYVVYDDDENRLRYDYTQSWNYIGVPVYYASPSSVEQAIKDHKEDFLILAGVK